ncbi:hypothetical protein AMAG_06113 [Allomyces macrogynus ATCC 38327]|uniref:NADP-dependent oxidoreductase domain-containing protein n=1 Tax=Allomyces macrogynus (strain ATCC 38327) TaxID=578462 RepID=A0A0L0SED9_ALLM3|nr:hypothetical protein AMAG_06113 [Allomyces macrogynus ATCC 38327]|eukprot:KNE60755.1 hypothetical protein AMAG_06113 [Allomyces macrogynus ATCC 38327]
MIKLAAPVARPGASRVLHAALFAPIRSRSNQLSAVALRSLPALARQFSSIPDTHQPSVDDKNTIPKTGARISPLAFGAYRIAPDNPTHTAALHAALAAGINVIDTAGHFGDGASESAIGQLLKSGKVDRKDLFLISKAGFVTPYVAMQAYPSAYDEMPDGALGPVGHSLDVNFLSGQLDNSLRQMQTNSIDLFMVNCPERLLRTMNAKQLEYRLTKAYEFLANETARGRIHGFGVTTTSPDWAFLPKAARQFAEAFHAVQVPANLCERQFLAPEFLQRIQEERLALFTHRLINAVTPRGVQRLASTPDPQHDLPEDLVDRLFNDFQALEQLEEALSQFVNDSVVLSKFVWSGVLAENLERIVANDMAARYYLDQQVAPVIRADLVKLKELATHSTTESDDMDADDCAAITQWCSEYEHLMITIRARIAALAHAHAVERHRAARDLLALTFLDARDAELEQAALALVRAARRDVPGSVLVGMRRPEYVESMVAASRIVDEDPELDRSVWDQVESSGVLDHWMDAGTGMAGSDA